MSPTGSDGGGEGEDSDGGSRAGAPLSSPRSLALAPDECQELLHNVVALDLDRKFLDLLPSWAFKSEYFQDGDGDVGVDVWVDRLHSFMKRAVEVLSSCQTITNCKDQLQF